MQKLMLATEAGPAYLSWVPGFTSGFSRVRVTRSLALCVCFVDRRLSFCYFFLAIVLSVLHLQIMTTPLVSSYSSRYKYG